MSAIESKDSLGQPFSAEALRNDIAERARKRTFDANVLKEKPGGESSGIA